MNYSKKIRLILFSLLFLSCFTENNTINTISESETLKDAELEISKIWTKHFNGTE